MLIVCFSECVRFSFTKSHHSPSIPPILSNERRKSMHKIKQKKLMRKWTIRLGWVGRLILGCVWWTLYLNGNQTPKYVNQPNKIHENDVHDIEMYSLPSVFNSVRCEIVYLIFRRNKKWFIWSTTNSNETTMATALSRWTKRHHICISLPLKYSTTRNRQLKQSQKLKNNVNALCNRQCSCVTAKMPPNASKLTRYKFIARVPISQSMYFNCV